MGNTSKRQNSISVERAGNMTKPPQTIVDLAQLPGQWAFLEVWTLNDRACVNGSMSIRQNDCIARFLMRSRQSRRGRITVRIKMHPLRGFIPAARLSAHSLAYYVFAIRPLPIATTRRADARSSRAHNVRPSEALPNALFATPNVVDPNSTTRQSKQRCSRASSESSPLAGPAGDTES